MRIKKDFILKLVAGEFVVVPTGEKIVDFTAMISLNETAAFLWRILEQEDVNEDELVAKILEEYELTEEKARQDIKNFISKLKEADLIDD